MLDLCLKIQMTWGLEGSQGGRWGILYEDSSKALGHGSHEA